MGKDRKYVNSPEMLKITKDIFTKAKHKGLTVNLGGAITTDSYEFLTELYKVWKVLQFQQICENYVWWLLNFSKPFNWGL